MKYRKKIALLITVLISVQYSIYSQPFSLDPAIEPIKLNMVKINPPKKPQAKGRIAISNITQVKDTMYFFANGFSIFSPAYVSVTAKDKSVPVEVSLFKQNWKSVSREGNTSQNGHWEDKFKTEGDFGIRIIARTKPSSYTIIVWNGDEVKVDMPSPFKNDKGKPAAADGGGKGFLKGNLLYIIIGLLVVIIGLLFFKLKNRKS